MESKTNRKQGRIRLNLEFQREARKGKECFIKDKFRDLEEKNQNKRLRDMFRTIRLLDSSSPKQEHSNVRMEN
jgi:inorganic triphosphatase YgiF